MSEYFKIVDSLKIATAMNVAEDFLQKFISNSNGNPVNFITWLKKQKEKLSPEEFNELYSKINSSRYLLGIIQKAGILPDFLELDSIDSSFEYNVASRVLKRIIQGDISVSIQTPGIPNVPGVPGVPGTTGGGVVLQENKELGDSSIQNEQIQEEIPTSKVFTSDLSSSPISSKETVGGSENFPPLGNSNQMVVPEDDFSRLLSDLSQDKSLSQSLAEDKGLDIQSIRNEAGKFNTSLSSLQLQGLIERVISRSNSTEEAISMLSNILER